MAVGTVQWFNAGKGFGLIRPDEGETDIFVPISAVERAGIPRLTAGQRISYEIDTGRNRTEACDLKIL